MLFIANICCQLSLSQLTSTAFLQVTPKPFTTLLSQKISPYVIKRIVLYSQKLSHKQLLYTSTHCFLTASL